MNLEHTFNEKGYFEDMQRMNQKWLNLFWKPFIG
jgi:L-amino acid N-acyltransferase YncA